MKTIKLTCHNCGANLNVASNIAYCSFCGTKLLLDDENQTITYNHNYVQRDETRIHEIEYEERKEKRDTKIGLIVGLGIPILIILLILLGSGIYKGIAHLQGKISVGYYSDYVGEDYTAVVKQFEEMGFSNIVTIDLDDSGIAFWNDGKVKSVSINGNDHFDDYSYFSPGDKVIIKYH